MESVDGPRIVQGYAEGGVHTAVSQVALFTCLVWRWAMEVRADPLIWGYCFELGLLWCGSIEI